MKLFLKTFFGMVLLVGGGGWFVAVVWAVWDYFGVAQAWWHYVLILIFAMVLPFWYAVVCWAHDGFFNTYTILVCVSAFCSALVQKAKSIPDEFWFGENR
jgi:hypothetical protein